MWLGKIKGKENRNRREMNEPNCVGTWLLFCDKKVFVDFSQGSNMIVCIIRGHSNCWGFKSKERSVSQACHCASAEFSQKGAQNRLIWI